MMPRAALPNIKSVFLPDQRRNRFNPACCFRPHDNGKIRAHADEGSVFCW
jgi:hypothetical protein